MAVFSWFGDACSCTRKKCDPSCMTYAHYLEERKPMTNADRIRAMTDDELADWLVMNGDGSDYKTHLAWLKEEVSG